MNILTRIALFFAVICACFAEQGFSQTKDVIITVQVCSYTKTEINNALETAKFLKSSGYQNVRVEHIGSLYTIRVGSYQTMAQAQKVNKRLQKQFPTSFVRNAYLIQQRIIWPKIEEEIITIIIEEEIPEQKKTVAIPQKQKEPLYEKSYEKPVIKQSVITQTDEIAPRKTQPKPKPVIKKESEKKPLISSPQTQTKQDEQEKTLATTGEQTMILTPALQGEGKKNRIEIGVCYEHLTPHETYGDWENFTIGFYRQQRKDFSYFILASGHFREQSAAIFTIGAYKDWTEKLFTYSDLSFGTNSDFSPRFRIDHDFNFKIKNLEKIVWTVGATYVKYYDAHRDIIISAGFTGYLEKWIVGYRLFRNRSDPGNVQSFSHIASIGYGKEDWQWTYLTLSYGKQAYLATNLLTPEEVNQNSLGITLYHRHWLKKHFGIFGTLSFFQLLDGYDKYGLCLGIFREF